MLDQKFYKIYKKFSPGPITYIVKKKSNSKVKPSACANLKTVGIRFPKNKMIRKLLKKLNFPLAMPSANKSSSISPVKPLDVYEEFDNNPYSYGPHNSFIFYLINYGLFGVLLFILIFTPLFKRSFNFNANFITVIVFLVLSMATDLLHNHSVAWLLYFAYFSYIKTEN